MSTRSSIDGPFGTPLSDGGAVVESRPANDIDWRSEADRCSCGFAVEGAEHIYNEEAFRYFLEIERKRSQLSNRPFLLLLLDVRRPAGARSEMDIASSPKLLSALSRCLRETDFIGWYRAGSVVGAVLTQDSGCAVDAQTTVSRRVTRALRESLSSDQAARVNVRVYQGSSTGPGVTW